MLLTPLLSLTCATGAAQFGKVDTNIYIMDYNPAVISAAQAFSISLSTFDSKVWF